MKVLRSSFILFSLFISSTFLSGQSQFPKDVLILGLTGDVKSMTKEMTLGQGTAESDQVKVVMFFDREGRIQKVENHKVGETKAEIATYQYIDDFTRILIQSEENGRDTALTERFEILSSGNLQFTTISKKRGEGEAQELVTVKTHTLDPQLNTLHIIENTSSPSENEMVLKFELIQTYIYENDSLIGIRGQMKQRVIDEDFGIDEIMTKEITMNYRFESYDEMGNLIFRETIDPYRTRLATERRSYEYY